MCAIVVLLAQLCFVSFSYDDKVKREIRRGREERVVRLRACFFLENAFLFLLTYFPLFAIISCRRSSGTSIIRNLVRERERLHFIRVFFSSSVSVPAMPLLTRALFKDDCVPSPVKCKRGEEKDEEKKWKFKFKFKFLTIFSPPT